MCACRPGLPYRTGSVSSLPAIAFDPARPGGVCAGRAAQACLRLANPRDGLIDVGHELPRAHVVFELLLQIRHGRAVGGHVRIDQHG